MARKKSTPPPEIEPDDSEIDEEAEDLWEQFSDDFPEIDMGFEDLDDLLQEEGEWYEEA